MTIEERLEAVERRLKVLEDAFRALPDALRVDVLEAISESTVCVDSRRDDEFIRRIVAQGTAAVLRAHNTRRG